MIDNNNYVEIKGTQENVGLTEVKSIFASGTRYGLVTCGKITLKAKQYMNSIGKIYVDRVPLELISEYELSKEEN